MNTDMYYPPQTQPPRPTRSWRRSAVAGAVGVVVGGAVVLAVVGGAPGVDPVAPAAEGEGISKAARAEYLSVLEEATSWTLRDSDEGDLMRAGRRACSLYATGALGQNVALETTIRAAGGKNPLPGVFGEGEDAALGVAEVLGAATATLCPEHHEQAMSEARAMTDLGW